MWPTLLFAPTLHLPVQWHTLDNGMEVVLLVDARAPLIATELTWRVGSAEDSIVLSGYPGCAGMAHLVEHLMFEGEYDTLLAEAGGESNAWTGHDWTTYTAVAPADALERLLYLESRRMADPMAGVSDDDLENQIAVVLTERSLSRGGGRGGRALSESLYPSAHPLHAPVLGDPDAIGAVGRAEIEAFLGAWYQPASAILVIGGDIDPEATLQSVQRWFGALPSGEPPARRTAEPPPSPSSGRRVLFENTSPTLMMAWPTVSRGHPDEPALDILAEVLAAGLHSRLGARVAAGHLDEARAWTENGQLGGRMVLSVSHHRRSSRALLREAQRAIDGFFAHPPGSAELAVHQERWRMWYVRSAQSLESRVAYTAGCLREVGEPDCLEQEIAAREALTPADLLAVASRYLLDEHRVLLTVHSRDRRPLSGAVEVDPL